MPVTPDMLDLPAKPGVYLFRTAKQRVLYVGKATVLSQRVRSYFAKNPDRVMIPELVENSDEIEFMSELCESHKTGTLLAIHRSWGDDGIKEVFRSLPKPESCAEQKIWTIIDDDVEDM